MVSATLVDPRTSAKSRVTSISAPPRYLRANLSHIVQMLGFFAQGRLPVRRISRPPTPRNGALHSLQRGSCGRTLSRVRSSRIEPPCPVIFHHHHSYTIY